MNLPDACEDFLWNTYFYLVEYVQQQEMNNITYFMLEENQRIHADHDAVPRFFVKNLEPDDDLNLSIPSDFFEEWDQIQNRGTLRILCGDTRVHDGSWKKRRDNWGQYYVMLQEGWGEVRAVGICIGNTICASIVVSQQWITVRIKIC